MLPVPVPGRVMAVQVAPWSWERKSTGLIPLPPAPAQMFRPPERGAPTASSVQRWLLAKATFQVAPASVDRTTLPVAVVA